MVPKAVVIGGDGIKKAKTFYDQRKEQKNLNSQQRVGEQYMAEEVSRQIFILNRF